MRLALNMAKIARGGFSRAAIEETQQQIRKPRAEVRDGKKWGVEFPRNKLVKPLIEWHPAMVYTNQTDSCIPCHNGTARHPQPRGRCSQTGAPPLEPAAALPRTLPLPRRHWRKSTLWNGQYAIQVCIYILCIPILNFSIIMHLPRIESAIKSFFQIRWVHYLLWGNTADIDLEDDSSLLSESESQDENWLKGTRVLSIVIIYN
jgi:hypothetical protein